MLVPERRKCRGGVAISSAGKRTRQLGRHWHSGSSRHGTSALRVGGVGTHKGCLEGGDGAAGMAAASAAAGAELLRRSGARTAGGRAGGQPAQVMPPCQAAAVSCSRGSPPAHLRPLPCPLTRTWPATTAQPRRLHMAQRSGSRRSQRAQAGSRSVQRGARHSLVWRSTTQAGSVQRAHAWRWRGTHSAQAASRSLQSLRERQGARIDGERRPSRPCCSLPAPTQWARAATRMFPTRNVPQSRGVRSLPAGGGRAAGLAGPHPALVVHSQPHDAGHAGPLELRTRVRARAACLCSAGRV